MRIKTQRFMIRNKLSAGVHLNVLSNGSMAGSWKVKWTLSNSRWHTKKQYESVARFNILHWIRGACPLNCFYSYHTLHNTSIVRWSVYCTASEKHRIVSWLMISLLLSSFTSKNYTKKNYKGLTCSQINLGAIFEGDNICKIIIAAFQKWCAWKARNKLLKSMVPRKQKIEHSKS